MRDLLRSSTTLALCALLAAACGPFRAESIRVDDEHYYENFVDLAEQADELGFTPYWLGRSFEAGGLIFEGPSVADFGADVTGGGISASYAARIQGGGTAPLNLTLYSPEAWRRVEDGVMNPRDPTTRRNVVVAGHDAEMLIISAGTRPVNAIRLVIHQGETTILANAGSVGPAMEGGPDLNPLVEPDTLLAAMQQLRAWPE